MKDNAELNSLFSDSLFDVVDTQNNNTNTLEIVKMAYCGAEIASWQDLFSGFDTLRAITFSSGINFIYKLLDMFDKAEIIFGCEHIMSYSLQEIIAYQDRLIDRIRENISASKQNLLSRIDCGEINLYVSREKISHEKIYLLSSNDGKKRVIMGSANLSYNAFGGRQRENICYIDGEEAYNWYSDKFEELKSASCDSISTKAINLADAIENIGELPISQTIKVNKAMVIETDKNMNDDIQFVLDTNNLSKKISPLVPQPEKKTGKIKISADTLIKVQRRLKEEQTKEKELRSEYPQLTINALDGTVVLNDKSVDLNPSKDEIKQDVDLFIKYMDGYSKFHGDYQGMQLRYFEFANWFFCSPFMAIMRDSAARFDQNRLPYPVFGLVYGQSKAGKTSFLETLLKMMIGQKPKVSAPDFTRSSIEGLKRTVQGAPIIVDDLTNNRFNQHAIETIKNDDFGVGEHLTNYSAVVISANEDVKAVMPEVIRRTVICRVEAGLTNTEVMQSNIVRSVQQKIGTAFYREYLRRMLEIVPDLIEELKDEESTRAPDILKLSSEVIVAIISEHIDVLPPYIRDLSLDNYFSEQVTGKHAIKAIRDAWRTNKKAFVINKKVNELCYDAGAPYEAGYIMKELPETLEARKTNSSIMMKLDEAEKFFNIKFKRLFFGKS